ncbi:hypothetical protein Leryth_007264, partial [Lithospermum erythrorhizon]
MDKSQSTKASIGSYIGIEMKSARNKIQLFSLFPLSYHNRTGTAQQSLPPQVHHLRSFSGERVLNCLQNLLSDGGGGVDEGSNNWKVIFKGCSKRGSAEIPESHIVQSCRRLLDERQNTNVLRKLLGESSLVVSGSHKEN